MGQLLNNFTDQVGFNLIVSASYKQKNHGRRKLSLKNAICARSVNPSEEKFAKREVRRALGGEGTLRMKSNNL